MLALNSFTILSAFIAELYCPFSFQSKELTFILSLVESSLLHEVATIGVIAAIAPSDDKVLKHDIFTFIHPNTDISEPKPKKNKNLEKIKEEQNSLINKFIEYDNKVILPKIVLKWPEPKEDNNRVSREIKKALGIWADQKSKFQ
ncbi:MAG: hypothetical protein HUJ52_04360, partial [Malacoplasma sp.]|nr:hypothetical protein [Malacoplasma sp.]